MNKDWVYKNIINSEEGILSDLACQLFLRRNLDRIDRDCYFGTETEIFRRIPGLRRLLESGAFESEIRRMIDEPVYYRERHYYVDPKGDFFARSDDLRYRHNRVNRVLVLKDTLGLVAAENVNEQQGAFFDDDAL